MTNVTNPADEGTIPTAHLYQLTLQNINRVDQLIHTARKELKIMSDASQAMLASLTDAEAANASLVGLAQALKAKVDEGSGAVAALAAEQAAHAATEADVAAASTRIAALAAGDKQAVTDNTPAA